MIYSKLVSYTNLAPSSNFYGKRTGNPTGFILHHAAAQRTAERLCNEFAVSSRGASPNYCIGYDGKIALSVPEEYAPGTSSSHWADNQCITVEISNSSYGYPWPVSEESINAVVALMTDCCVRWGIAEIVFNGQVDGSNLWMHRYFDATECPGATLASRFAEIAQRVNEKLQKSKEPKEDEPMTDAEKKSFQEMQERLERLESVALPKWGYVDSNLPAFSYNTVKKLVDSKILQGDNGNLQLNYEMLRLLVILDRAGMFAGVGENEPSESLQKAWEESTKAGIVNGEDPKKYATREQVSAMIQRAKGGKLK